MKTKERKQFLLLYKKKDKTGNKTQIWKYILILFDSFGSFKIIDIF
jgi:hypothetical protein